MTILGAQAFDDAFDTTFSGYTKANSEVLSDGEKNYGDSCNIPFFKLR